MCIYVDSSTSNWIEWTQHVETFCRAEAKYHFVPCYHNERLSMQSLNNIRL